MPGEDKASILFPVYTGHELYIIIPLVRINWAIILADNGTLMTAKQRHLRAAPSSAPLPVPAPPNCPGPGRRPSPNKGCTVTGGAARETVFLTCQRLRTQTFFLTTKGVENLEGETSTESVLRRRTDWLDRAALLSVHLKCSVQILTSSIGVKAALSKGLFFFKPKKTSTQETQLS